MLEHMRKVANTSVRNAGCWAGNLMLAHDHPDFPSDLFTLFAAAGATLQISSRGSIVTQDLFGFLQMNMSQSVLLSLTLPFLSTPYTSYKVAMRHTNSHAYVNAAFNIAVDATGTGV